MLATLHANSANQALDRIINFFPDERREQLLMDLSLNIRALVSQRLIPREAGRGRIAAMEIMLNSPLIQDLIFKGEVAKIKEVMSRSTRLGMQTFDQSLFELYEAGYISYEDALRNADSKNELRLRIKLESKREHEDRRRRRRAADRRGRPGAQPVKAPKEATARPLGGTPGRRRRLTAGNPVAAGDPGHPTLNTKPLFKLMVEKKASDLFFTSNAPIKIKIEGQILPVNKQVLTPETVRQTAFALMNAGAARALQRGIGARLRDLRARARALPRQRLHAARLPGRWCCATSPPTCRASMRSGCPR